MSFTRYFAYGSNMAESVMAAHCPGHRYIGPADLPEHRLAFTRRSVRTLTGVADIVRADGQSVWGALYELDESDLLAIDRKEGNGSNYERMQVRVRPGGHEPYADALRHFRGVAVDGWFLAECRLELGGREGVGVDRAEPFAQAQRPQERLLHGDLLIKRKADEQGHRVAGDQRVGIVGFGEVQAVGHRSILAVGERATGRRTAAGVGRC